MNLYVPKHFQFEYRKFCQITGDSKSRVLCSLIQNFIYASINLHIPTIRKILQNNPQQRKYLQELLDETI